MDPTHPPFLGAPETAEKPRKSTRLKGTFAVFSADDRGQKTGAAGRRHPTPTGKSAGLQMSQQGQRNSIQGPGWPSMIMQYARAVLDSKFCLCLHDLHVSCREYAKNETYSRGICECTREDVTQRNHGSVGFGFIFLCMVAGRFRLQLIWFIRILVIAYRFL